MIKRLLAFLTCVCFFSNAAFAVPLIRDAEIEHTLRLYGDPIFKAAGVKPSSVHIFIVQDDSLNAYVAGGANLFIHTGLIEATDTPDMLLGVMAHETGHIAGGHLAQGTEKLKDAQLGTILSFVLGAAAAVASHQPGAAAAVIGGGQSTVGRNYLAFTRAHEEAADQSALTSLDKLDISASGFLKVFSLLQRNERQHPGSPDPYLLTHPLTSERIEHVRNHVETSSIPEGQYPKQFDILHRRMIAKLYGFLESPERTMQKYPLSDKSVPARMARAIAYYQMPDLDKSMTEMNSLLAEAPNDPFFHELKGQILFENSHVKDALADYEKAGTLLPDSPLILTDLAKVEMAQKEPALIPAAIGHLEHANSIDNSNPDTWRLLGTAYGQENNMGMSYLSLAEEAILEDDPKGALRQVNQALTQLKEGTPARQRAQDLKAHAIEMKRDRKDAESPF
jgi:predicted Zn-dependent protease